MTRMITLQDAFRAGYEAGYMRGRLDERTGHPWDDAVPGREKTEAVAEEDGQMKLDIVEGALTI